jgi:hypothetical protein
MPCHPSFPAVRCPDTRNQPFAVIGLHRITLGDCSDFGNSAFQEQLFAAI